MATEKDEIMSRTGPEDNLVAVRTNVNSSEFRTAGSDWVIGRGTAYPAGALHYKDVDEQQRLTAQVLSHGPAGDILRDLAAQRNICTKQVYMNKVRPARRRASGPYERQCAVVWRGGAGYKHPRRDYAMGWARCDAARAFGAPARERARPTHSRWLNRRCDRTRLPLSSPPQMCLDSFHAHQAKQCTPTMLEYVKCGTKL